MEAGRKVVIVGAGMVGTTFAYTLMRSGLAGEIVLIDMNRERAEAEAMDMNHGLFFTPPVILRAGDYDDCAGASVIVIAAGAKPKVGQTRLDVVHSNVGICRGIMDETPHTGSGHYHGHQSGRRSYLLCPQALATAPKPRAWFRNCPR